jgi:energy-coupling factor transporter transmembrane protein EcfT
MACAVLLVAALIAMANVKLLSATALVGTLLAVSISSSRSAHLKFLLWIWLPLTAWLALVWGWIVAAPPNVPIHSDRMGGLLYALQISLRLEAMAAVIQAAFLSMTLEQIGAGLLSLRVPRDIALTIMSVFALGPELRKRADQVLTARIARGLARRGRKWQALQNIAATLMPLVAWGFRSSMIRSDYWTQRGVLDSPQLRHRAAFTAWDLLYIGLALSFCALAVFRTWGISQ